MNLSGTDWVLVTTSDGKKFYHNSKTKVWLIFETFRYAKVFLICVFLGITSNKPWSILLALSHNQVSSWQIPNEVIEMRKKQDGETSKEHPVSVPNNSQMVEKESSPISLNAPAISTGGREAMAYKASTVQGSTSALDLIKKKLQDSGAPVTSSPVSGPSELNGSRGFESTPKVHQSENSKDKLHDTNGDGNMSDSSSDSEDADSGPTKEEGIIQFKVYGASSVISPYSGDILNLL